jgi:hypothetical protein
LFEVKERGRRREQSDIGSDPKQVRRTQDESNSRKRIPSERAISRLVMKLAAVTTRFRTAFPEANQDRLQEDRKNKERCPDKENACVSNYPRGEIGKQRTDQGARCSARRDDRE